MAHARSAMKVTTVRFGADLWRLLGAEAGLAGVSVSQYIREAALARAAAAAASRGEDPLALLAGVEPTPSRKRGQQESERSAALLQRAAETGRDNRRRPRKPIRQSADLARFARKRLS